MEQEGKFLILGNEWTGSLIKYDKKPACFSGLFAPDDPFFTNIFGNDNDECEYFVNGVINNDRFFIQSYVFDTTFEIEFDFGTDKKVFQRNRSTFSFNQNKGKFIRIKENIELNFVQQNSKKLMYVTSNPFFAFHDDAFPAFAKNIYSQPVFPRSAHSVSRPYPKTIVPDISFTELEGCQHISTLELELNGTENFSAEFDLPVRRIYLIVATKYFSEGKRE